MRRHLLLCALVALGGCQPADDVAQALLLQQCSDNNAPLANLAAACTSLIDAPASTPEIIAFALGNRCLARMRSRDLDGALTDLNRLAELTPNVGWVFGRRGVLHGMRGEFDAAARDLEAAIKLTPDIPDLHADLGTAYERGGQPERALPAYNRAIELDPTFAAAVGGRCWILAVLGRDLDQAIADYDRSLAGTPVASSFYVRGLAKRALGRTQEGDVDIARGKQMEPGVAERYATFGVAAP